MAERVTMPRKKGDPPEQPRRGHAVVVKGTEEWKRWIETAAEHLRVNVATLVDLSVTEYVKARGYDVPPPNR